MIYAISDIHGQFDLFLKMLDKIHFDKDTDEMYVLGDCIDRGDKSLETIDYMRNHSNMHMILGNHEYMMYAYWNGLYEGIYPTDSVLDIISQNGGNTTFQQLAERDASYLEKFNQFIRGLPIYLDVEVNNEKFTMVHAGLFDYFSVFEENKVGNAVNPSETLKQETLKAKNIDSNVLLMENILFRRDTFDKLSAENYNYTNKIIIGHTPTVNYSQKYYGKIIQKQSIIAIDCGSFFTDCLGCICLNTLEEFYVSK